MFKIERPIEDLDKLEQLANASTRQLNMTYQDGIKAVLEFLQDPTIEPEDLF